MNFCLGSPPRANCTATSASVYRGTHLLTFTGKDGGDDDDDDGDDDDMI